MHVHWAEHSLHWSAQQLLMSHRPLHTAYCRTWITPLVHTSYIPTYLLHTSYIPYVPYHFVGSGPPHTQDSQTPCATQPAAAITQRWQQSHSLDLYLKPTSNTCLEPACTKNSTEPSSPAGRSGQVHLGQRVYYTEVTQQSNFCVGLLMALVPAHRCCETKCSKLFLLQYLQSD